MAIKTPSITSITNLSSDKGSDLTYKDLKIGCIIRGMPFIDVLRADFFKLSNFIQSNILVKQNLDLLDEYDDWLEAKLRRKGADEMIHSSLRLGYVKKDEDDEYIPKAKKEVKEKKAPRKKDDNGLYQGTMKSYTYELQKKGKTVEQVITKVTRKFPQALPKSVKIWFNKSKKE